MRKLCSLIAIVAFILNGCSQELEVKTADSITTEYGEELENSKLYDAKESDENVTVKKVDGYDAKKLGEQTLDVIFTDGNKETEKQIKVKVEDTKKPEIELKKDKITITAGDKLTLKDNVKSVKDPIDGDLKYSNKKVEKSGYYIDKGKLDTGKAGTYEVKVLAYDANGNASEKTFKVIVEKKKEVKKEKSKATTNNNTVTNTVNDSNKKQDSAGQSTGQQPPATSNNTEEDNIPVSDSPIVKAALAQVGGKGICSSVAETAINAVGKSAWIEETITNEDGSTLTQSTLTPENFTKLGVSVGISQMRPGDILYYTDGGAGVSHVAVYIGNNKAVHGGWLGNNMVVETIYVGSGVSGVYRFD